MYSVLVYSVDCNTIFNACTVSICLWACFVKIKSHLRDCNRCDDWHPCQIMNYIICKPIWSCPTCMLLHALIFILFNDTNLLFVNLYNHAPPICCHNVLFSFCSLMLLYYICKSTWSCFPFLLHVLFSFCQIYHICTSLWSCTQYMIFSFCLMTLLYFVYITCLWYTDMYVCILYCSSINHLKPYANH